MRTFLICLLVLSMSGCGKKEKVLSGGKPASHWAVMLQDPDPVQRKKATFKLGNMGAADASAFPPLVVALRDRDAEVRCEAVLALVKIGAQAKEAIPELIEVEQQDQDERVRVYASKALNAIQSNANKKRS